MQKLLALRRMNRLRIGHMAVTTRSMSTDDKSLDVVIVGSGIGGTALALALAQNNRLENRTMHGGSRCAVCGHPCGIDYSPRHRGRRGESLGLREFVDRRMRQHHEHVHAGVHPLHECFPSATGASHSPSPITFQVFEKDAAFSARRQGYGLTMQQGAAALERLGLMHEAREKETPSNAHYVFGNGGQLLNVFSSKAFGKGAAARDGDAWVRQRNLTMPRQRLRELLLDRLRAHDSATVSWGWQYSRHETRADGRLAVTFERQPEDGGPRKERTVLARVLVGADGLWSGVRRHVLQHALRQPDDLEYLGVLVVLGESHLPYAGNICE